MSFEEAVMTGKPIRLPCSCWAWQIGVNWWMYMPTDKPYYVPKPCSLIPMHKQYPEVTWAGTYEGRPYMPWIGRPNFARFGDENITDFCITDNDWEVLSEAD